MATARHLLPHPLPSLKRVRHPTESDMDEDDDDAMTGIWFAALFSMPFWLIAVLLVL